MTKEEVIQRLKAENRVKVAKDTGLPYGYLCRLVYDKISNPGSAQMDALRSYFISLDITRERKQERRA